MKQKTKTRYEIANRVRELRKQRRWTQAELAGRLGISQSRLSELERGAGSFTAEQFIAILSLFNVPVSDFAPDLASDPDASIQQALARLGASHLYQSDEIVPDQSYDDPALVLKEALLAGDPRLVTALGPVLAQHAGHIQLKTLQARLAEAGLEHRLFWLAQNVLDALRSELKQVLPRSFTKSYRRAAVVLETFLEHAGPSAAGRFGDEVGLDIMDPSIRSKRTIKEVRASSSPISQRWNIVTSIHSKDFSKALRESRVGL